MIYGDCERGRRDLEPGVGSGMLEGGLQGYGLGGGFSHSCDILGSKFGYGGYVGGGSGVSFGHTGGFQNSVNFSNMTTEMNNMNTNNFYYTEMPREDIPREVPDTVENTDPGFKEGGGGFEAGYKDGGLNKDGEYYYNCNGDGSFDEGRGDFENEELIVTL